jgi:hypothetical protein
MSTEKTWQLYIQIFGTRPSSGIVTTELTKYNELQAHIEYSFIPERKI